MPEGGILTVETGNADDPIASDEARGAPAPRGPCIAISVSDTGTGMDEATKSHIFAPFFTTKKSGKGTGLGLAGVCNTVRNLGGHIAVDTERQKGSTFTIYLPLTDDLAPEEEEKKSRRDQSLRSQQENTESSSSQTSKGQQAEIENQDQSNGKQSHQHKEKPMTGHGTILVVDDEPVILETTCSLLSSLGYATHACENGPQAIEYYQQHHGSIRAVVLDSIMPRMTGMDCLRKLKEINPDIIAIIASGHSSGDAQEKALEEGAKAFLMKPFKREELGEVMEKILK
jgi:CheY-like chemotaxis protein